MKKLVLAIAMALSFVLPAFTATTVSAAEESKLDAAAKYYAQSVSVGLYKGFELQTGNEISAVKKAQLEKLFMDFTVKSVIPCMKRHGLVDEWIKSQNDPKIRELNAKILKAKSIQDLQPIMVESVQYTQKNYPNLLVKMMQDQVYLKEFQQMTLNARNIILKQ